MHMHVHVQVSDTRFDSSAVLDAAQYGGGGAVAVYGHPTYRSTASFVRTTWRNSTVYSSAPAAASAAASAAAAGGTPQGGGAVNATGLALLALSDCVFEGSTTAVGSGGALLVTRVRTWARAGSSAVRTGCHCTSSPRFSKCFTVLILAV